MSAPVSRDPLVVNTKDGSCWVRRALASDGRGLYALEGTPLCCPEYVLTSLTELAEIGLTSMADVLPVPVGSEPQESSVDADRAKAPWGRGEDGRPLLPMGAHWTDIPELVDRELARIRARVDQAQSGHWYVSPVSELPDTVCTRVDGYHRTVGRFTNMLPADLELVLHAHDDLSWCLGMISKLRARVAELEAVLVAERARHTQYEDSPHCQLDGEFWPCQTVAAVGSASRPTTDESADRLTRMLAPTQALREDPHEGPLHHSYLVSRDLPEMGGAS